MREGELVEGAAAALGGGSEAASPPFAFPGVFPRAAHLPCLSAVA